MIIRIYNDDSTDYVDYEADTLEEIRENCKKRITIPGWSNGHSEVLEE